MIIRNTNKDFNILIVDDEGSIRQTLREILEFENYNVEEAPDGLEAIIKVYSEKFHLVIMDIKMPLLDGVSAMEKIMTFNSKIPILVISGHANIDTAVEVVKMGAFDFISKPPDLNRMLITVRNAIEKSNLLIDLNSLNKTKNSLWYTSSLNIPVELRTPMQQYILFFKEFVKISKNVDIDFNVIQNSSGLTIEIGTASEKYKENLKEWFLEYTNYIKEKNDNILVKFENEISKEESDILIAELKNQIRFFESSMEILKLKNKTLKHKNKSLKHEKKLLKKISKGYKNLGLGSVSIIEKVKDGFFNKFSKGKYDQLKYSIGEGGVHNVIKTLTVMAIDRSMEDLTNQLIVIKSNYESLNNNNRTNTIAGEDFRMQNSKINKSLLEIIDKLSEFDKRYTSRSIRS